MTLQGAIEEVQHCDSIIRRLERINIIFVN